MMTWKFCCLVGLSLWLVRPASAQVQQSNLLLTDLNGLPLSVKAVPKLSGSTSYWATWQHAVIYAGGKQQSVDSLNIDVLDKSLLLAKHGQVFTLTLAVDSLVVGKAPEQRKLIWGWGEQHKSSDGAWYEVLCEGRLTFLKRKSKIVNEVKDYGAATGTVNIRDSQTFYLVKSHKLEELKLTRKSLFNMLTVTEQDSLKKYLDDHGIKLKTAEDFALAINYLNTLE